MKKVTWITKGEKLQLMGPFGMVNIIVESYNDENETCSLKVLPSTQLPSPENFIKHVLSKREEV